MNLTARHSGRRARWAAGALAGALAVAVVLSVAPAQSSAQEKQDPGEMASKGLDALMKALRLFIDEIPQYAAPEINERGDIIIRRLNPDKKPPEPKDQGETRPTEDT